MPTVDTGDRVRRMADCHPSQVHYAFGMCWDCYSSAYGKSRWVKYKKTLTENRQRLRKENPERFAAYERKYKHSHESKRLMRKYGITLAFYNELLAKQHGKCAICGGGNGTHKLAIDHCHATGRVRGLLCKRCNTAIGMLNDNPDLLLRASDYVRQIPFPCH